MTATLPGMLMIRSERPTGTPMKHWVENHGHFLTREEVAGVTGLSIAEIAGNPAFVASPGCFGTNETYPAAQFDAMGSPTPGLDALAAALGDDADRWDFIAFLTSPLPGLNGQTAFGWLQNGGDIGKVIRLAK
jgi:hypothetical protein